VIEVVDPGLLLTIQDAGRHGWAHLGVPRSGAADPEALSAVNLRLGNAAGWAAFETTLTGASLRFAAASTVCVGGADAEVCVDGQEVAFGEAIEIPEGSLLTVGRARSCVRSYIAVAGGLQVIDILGSASADLLTGLGTPPLGVGDRVGLAHRITEGNPGEALVAAEVPPVLAISAGPHSLTGNGSELFGQITGTTSWEVLPSSNRVGARLRQVEGNPLSGADPISRSLPMPRGAVQMPPGGELIALLADGPTTGGYPVVGVLAPGALAAAGRLRPGARVRFEASVPESA
jgi:biotin-dependent carboxylase-like uncharacterized protein